MSKVSRKEGNETTIPYQAKKRLRGIFIPFEIRKKIRKKRIKLVKLIERNFGEKKRLCAGTRKRCTSAGEERKGVFEERASKREK